MQAIILAGGQGTRLSPVLAPGLPKAAASVAGRPFVRWQAERLCRAGVTHMTFALGYGARILRHIIESFAPCLSASVSFVIEESPLDTGGALREALQASRFQHADNDVVLVTNGDVFTDASPLAFKRFYDEQTTSSCLGCVLCIKMEHTGRFGVMQVAPDGRVLGFAPTSDPKRGGLINAGMYLLPYDFFERFAPPAALYGACSLEADVFPVALPQSRARAMIVKADFIDIGTPEDYREAQHAIPRMARRFLPSV